MAANCRFCGDTHTVPGPEVPCPRCTASKPEPASERYCGHETHVPRCSQCAREAEQGALAKLREENARLRQELEATFEVLEAVRQLRADDNSWPKECALYEAMDRLDGSRAAVEQLTEARERLAAAERVIEAAEAIADRSRPLLVRDRVAYERALATYQALKRPDKEE